MTRDAILTLSLLLASGPAARLTASLLQIPEILGLLGVGALLRPSLLDVIEVPLRSLGAQFRKRTEYLDPRSLVLDYCLDDDLAVGHSPETGRRANRGRIILRGLRIQLTPLGGMGERAPNTPAGGLDTVNPRLNHPHIHPSPHADFRDSASHCSPPTMPTRVSG